MSRKRKAAVHRPPEERIREGSARGAARVSEEFASVITRKVFCARAGIHKTTLKRWEQSGIVKPTMRPVLGIETAVFSEEQLEVGTRAARLLQQNPGTMTLAQAFQRAREKGEG